MITQYILPSILILIAGAMEAVMDKIAFHNDSNNRWWGGECWKNKYLYRDPERGLTFIGKYFIFLCDGWHFCKMVMHLCIFSSISILVKVSCENYSWWQCCLVGLSFWAINRIGFNIIWKLFK